MVLGFVAVGLLLIMLDGLYLARIAAGRQEEIKRIVRTMVLLTALAAGATELMRRPVSPVSPLTMVVAGAIAIVLLVWCRGGYRAWLDGARARGLYQREVIVLGTCADAAELVTMFDDHPEAGYTVRGVVGDASDARELGLFDLYLGSFDGLEAILGEQHIDGVIAIAGGAPSKVLSPLLAHLESTGIHVQYSNGLLGTSPQRLRATPVAFQSLYYVEPSCGVESPRLMVKRVFDVFFATFLIIVTAPLMIAIALAISLTDSGPVLFRHQRAGRGGTTFAMLKFRSMVVDADQHLDVLRQSNERTGPLFKMKRDPRVTPVGRLLRATSLDELPQLWNVLRGEMSIVGPRPVEVSESQGFDERLLQRLRMPPGMTGLWQVEARDNPHFGAFRRLDLFYIDNWSMTLDLVILIATIDQVIAHALRRGAMTSDLAPVRSDPPALPNPV